MVDTKIRFGDHTGGHRRTCFGGRDGSGVGAGCNDGILKEEACGRFGSLHLCRGGGSRLRISPRMLGILMSGVSISWPEHQDRRSMSDQSGGMQNGSVPCVMGGL